MGKISEIFNFDNIGIKIKNFTKWSCWITILLIWIAAPITFIVLVSDDWTAYLCWIPLVGAIVGPVLVWVGSWLLYAFGEFVEDVHAIRDKEGTTKEANTKRKKAKIKHEAELKAKQKTEIKEKQETEKITKWQIENEYQGSELSDDDFIDITCPKCGEMLSFLKNEAKGICPECGTEFEIK